MMILKTTLLYLLLICMSPFAYAVDNGSELEDSMVRVSIGESYVFLGTLKKSPIKNFIRYNNIMSNKYNGSIDFRVDSILSISYRDAKDDLGFTTRLIIKTPFFDKDQLQSELIILHDIMSYDDVVKLINSFE